MYTWSKQSNQTHCQLNSQEFSKRISAFFRYIHTKEQLENSILQTKQLMNTENLSTIENTTTDQRIKYNRDRSNLQLLEMSFHID